MVMVECLICHQQKDDYKLVIDKELYSTYLVWKLIHCFDNTFNMELFSFMNETNFFITHIA